MPVIAFDLDDTLYDETTFADSGFSVVATYIEKRYNIPHSLVYSIFREKAKCSRNRVFDRAFTDLGIYTARLVRECVRIYRTHTPDISLWAEAERCLERFAGFPIYIVTDGNVTAQAGKLKALGLYDHPHVKRCILTWRYGRSRGKPSPYCFELICKRERTKPDQVVYVGDNPLKDFVGIRPLGFRTVRVRTGQHGNLEVDAEYRADVEIENLDHLDFKLLRNLGLRVEV